MDCATDYKVKPQMLKDLIKATNYQPYDEYIENLNIKNQKGNTNFFTKRGTGVNISNKSIANTSTKPSEISKSNQEKNTSYATSPRAPES